MKRTSGAVSLSVIVRVNCVIVPSEAFVGRPRSRIRVSLASCSASSFTATVIVPWVCPAGITRGEASVV